MRLLSQISAHGMGDSNDPRDFKLEEVPTGLIAELGVQIGAQSARNNLTYDRRTAELDFHFKRWSSLFRRTFLIISLCKSTMG